MTHFRRWTAGLFSRVDWLVAKVENHEALADSSLLDMRRALARAHAQLKRVERDGQALRQERDARMGDEHKWRERARAEHDQERALECLKRARLASRRAEELSGRLEEHERFEHSHRKEIARLRDQVEELLRRRNQMRTRASRAHAANAIHTAGGIHLDDVFERWEEHLVEQELDAEPYEEPVDTLEEAYVEAEERAELERELCDLRGES